MPASEVCTRRMARMVASQLGAAFGRSCQRSSSVRQYDALLPWARAFLPDHFLLPPSELHTWLAGQCDRAITDRGRMVAMIGPRGAAKSTIASLAFPLRCAVEGFDQLIWLVSETSSQAAGNLQNIKHELQNNELLAAVYPHAAGRGPLWRVDRIRLNNGVAIEAYGMGQRIRGRRHGASRPTLIVCDDLQSDAVLSSRGRRERESAWFQGALMNAGSQRTNVLVVGTALHRDDVAMRLIRTPGWQSRVFAAIPQWPQRMELWAQWAERYHNLGDPKSAETAKAFYVERQSEMDAGAESLWPESESLYELMQLREEVGHTAFAREKQGVPINPDICEWSSELFDGAGFWFSEWPRDVHWRCLALDPSKGRDARLGDYSAIVRLEMGTDGYLYADADLARRDTTGLIETALAMYQDCGADFFSIEVNQFQELLADELRRVAAVAGVSLPIVTLTNTVNKELRIRRLGPYLTAKRIRFREGSPGARLLVDQLRDFPMGDHDDGPDALEMAIRTARDILRQQESDS